MSDFARQPRTLVLVNGAPIDGVESWQVDNNTRYQADTFKINFVLAAKPQDYAAQMAFWGSLGQAQIQIFAGFPADPNNFSTNDLTSLIIGNVDELDLDPVGNAVTAFGRDKSALLQDTKTTDKFVQKTASQIATILAARHGLDATVVPTSTPAGNYYKADQVVLTDDRSEWDLLIYLAQKENYRVVVAGNTLRFEPIETSVSTYEIRVEGRTADQPRLASNALSLTFTRNLTLARDVSVIVYSWTHEKKRRFSVRAGRPRIRNANNPPGGRSPSQLFTRTIPNLTQAQAQQYANQLVEQISKHELVLHAELPGDVLLSASGIVRVTGVGSVFDADYYPVSVLRSFSFTGGFTMKVDAKNHSPENTVTV